MPLYKARQGKDAEGKPVYGATFAYEPMNPDGPAATNAAAKVESGAWVEVETEDKPLEKRSVAELKTYADENGVDLGEATKKVDILAAIRAAEGDGDSQD